MSSEQDKSFERVKSKKPVALTIPPSMLSSISPYLEEHGITCVEIPLPKEWTNGVLELKCCRGNGECRISVEQVSENERTSENLFLAVWPLQGFFRRNRCSEELKDEIVRVLTERGCEYF